MTVDDDFLLFEDHFILVGASSVGCGRLWNGVEVAVMVLHFFSEVKAGKEDNLKPPPRQWSTDRTVVISNR